MTASALLIGAAVPAMAAESMRVTFVRHGQSEGNASGNINTQTPGPVLTPLGQQQARDVVGLLGDNNYDAIYASTMVRTQLTAAPMSQYLGLPIQVLPGLQEIEAGVFENTPEANASRGYGLYPIGWALPGVIEQLPVNLFNKDTFMPGTTLNGHVFDARVDGALQTMYDNGDRNAIVFSHGGTIMFWTMMNAKNLSPTQKLQLLQTAALGNTDYVVIEGNNEDGWTLTDWNGQRFSPEPTLGAEIALQTRTLKRQLAAATDQVVQAIATRDITKILTAINRSAADAQLSVTKFSRAVNAKIVNEIGKVTSGLAQPADTGNTPAPHSQVASVTAAKTDATDTVQTSNVAARTSATSVPSGGDSAKPRDTATASDATTSDESTGTEGATSMRDGNKTVPLRGARPVVNGSRDRLSVDSIKDAITSITQRFGTKGDAAPTGSAGTGTTSDSGANDSTSASSDSESGGSESDAA
ncbi:histidine phosphatase family protein [Mycobacterium sp. NPDC051804]|uniref:histidine phosphatase family protein n=1 Tax=Mycobacterium sp. NPDC051804 TaxID=3364295 RepID=UPI0037A292D1